MAFQRVRFLKVNYRYVTLTSRGITFREKTQDAYGLLEYDFAELGVDEALRRLYFKFIQWESNSSVTFQHRTPTSRSRVVPVAGLFARYEWIAAMKSVKETTRRQLLLETVEPERDHVPDGFDYFVTIEHSRHKGLRFHPKYFPRAGGIYWLRNEFGDVVRIGESDNMASHLFRQGQSLGSRVVTFDYEIIENRKQRLATELEYLDAHTQLHGVPPPFNPILLKKKADSSPKPSNRPSRPRTE